MFPLPFLGGGLYRYLFTRCVNGDENACIDLAELHLLVRSLRGFSVPRSPLPPLPGPQPDPDPSSAIALFALVDLLMAGPQPEPPSVFGHAFSLAVRLEAAKSVHSKLTAAVAELENWIARLEQAES
jgi:hypothetical protein